MRLLTLLVIMLPSLPLSSEAMVYKGSGIPSDKKESLQGRVHSKVKISYGNSRNSNRCFFSNQPLLIGDLFLINGASSLVGELIEISIFDEERFNGFAGSSQELNVTKQIVPLLKNRYPDLQIEVDIDRLMIHWCQEMEGHDRSHFASVPGQTQGNLNVTGVYLSNLIIKYLSEHCNDCYLEIDSFSVLEDLSVGLDRRPRRVAGTSQSKIVLEDGLGKVVAQLDSSRLLIKGRAWITQKSLKQGEMPSLAHLKESEVKLEFGDWLDILPRQIDINQFQLVRFVRAFQPLRKSDVRLKPVVKSLDRVKGILRKPGIELQTPVTVLNSGYLGDKIPIRVEATKKILSARVTAQDEVEILESNDGGL
ncbi:MAG: flagellar basal body P-ring formation chaperone FlgA [Bdellovibrionaceae bacterium]|nr:flagellar basal body P-ring formation chaperone FlgA [Pseudobdellovibrionaceae bacterium]MDW8190650.1 flagellar basal body P-ring formation chaperone FlgA [Pseudobdellovibrionaceae bacterium]